MSHSTLPPALVAALESAAKPDAIFAKLMPALGRTLDCDRCFLYLRDPQTAMGRVPYCWRRESQYPEVYDPDWKPEPANLSEDDPMFAAALATTDSIFVEDVETAPPDVLNRDFEQEQFGHRALIHAHLCQSGALWGVLQPCVFGRPHVWTADDRQLIHQIVQHITPLAVAYVQAAAAEIKAAQAVWSVRSH